MANSAIHPSGVGKWVVIHVIRYMDYGVKTLRGDWGVVCMLAATVGPIVR